MWHPNLKKKWTNDSEFEIIDKRKENISTFLQLRENKFLSPSKDCRCKFVPVNNQNYNPMINTNMVNPTHSKISNTMNNYLNNSINSLINSSQNNSINDTLNAINNRIKDVNSSTNDSFSNSLNNLFPRMKEIEKPDYPMNTFFQTISKQIQSDSSDKNLNNNESFDFPRQQIETKSNKPQTTIFDDKSKIKSDDKLNSFGINAFPINKLQGLPDTFSRDSYNMNNSIKQFNPINFTKMNSIPDFPNINQPIQNPSHIPSINQAFNSPLSYQANPANNFNPNDFNFMNYFYFNQFMMNNFQNMLMQYNYPFNNINIPTK